MSGSHKLVWVFGGVFVFVMIGIVILVFSGPDIDSAPVVPTEPVETDGPGSARTILDGLLQRDQRSPKQYDGFVTGSYCVCVRWSTEWDEMGAELVSNLMNAVGYKE